MLYPRLVRHPGLAEGLSMALVLGAEGATSWAEPRPPCRWRHPIGRAVSAARPGGLLAKVIVYRLLFLSAFFLAGAEASVGDAEEV